MTPSTFSSIQVMVTGVPSSVTRTGKLYADLFRRIERYETDESELGDFAGDRATCVEYRGAHVSFSRTDCLSGRTAGRGGDRSHRERHRLASGIAQRTHSAARRQPHPVI